MNLHELRMATVPGGAVTVWQMSPYPNGGQMPVQPTPDGPPAISVWLRVPFDAARTQVRLISELVPDIAVADGYFGLTRTWAAGDTLELAFEMPVTVQPFLDDR